jgi:hypothetical protein
MNALSIIQSLRNVFTFREASVFDFRKGFVLSGLRISAVVCLSVITMIAAFTLSGCGGSSAPISVVVTASATTADGPDGASAALRRSTLSAAVTNDKSTGSTPDGVTWTSSVAGVLSSNTSTTGATFTAPAASRRRQSGYFGDHHGHLGGGYHQDRHGDDYRSGADSEHHDDCAIDGNGGGGLLAAVDRLGRQRHEYLDLDPGQRLAADGLDAHLRRPSLWSRAHTRAGGNIHVHPRT